ncbi:SDR family oxidoreductase [Starkeya sp. ORNL1]|uniref:NAD-dependent epimerase/dehydratase family protein n=1 Tax=Starkeya sp. ORNL1 TaxID=2709380 RepID=UPI001463A6E9|nr:SDR family oxidoreductase [Starkeya sp. ORNL1]QJP14290.1 SDR family oxidoreductase [Starkeya sp. ORNL1]
MNILVTGGAGYLGSVLVPNLLMRGHNVRVIDIGYFGLSHLRGLTSQMELIGSDLTRINSDKKFLEDLLDKQDCIIHLAALSNDPSAEAYPSLTYALNFYTTSILAKAARDRGIRFVFASSCSVYGENDGELIETSSVNPRTIYAQSKYDAENELLRLASASWRPVILRCGTLFGFSRRMRFDLVVNVFSLYSTLHNRIRVFGDGLQWRPFLSVQDCARAFMLTAETKNLSFMIYNVANENLRISEVANTFKRINPSLQVTYVPTQDPDQRDYRVSAKRIADEGFYPHLKVEAGAKRVASAITQGLINDPESSRHNNLKWLRELNTKAEAL